MSHVANMTTPSKADAVATMTMAAHRSVRFRRRITNAFANKQPLN
jgi:hypothetical protein